MMTLKVESRFMSNDRSGAEWDPPSRLRRLLILITVLLLLASVTGTLYVATTDFETDEAYTGLYILNESGAAAE